MVSTQGNDVVKFVFQKVNSGTSLKSEFNDQ